MYTPPSFWHYLLNSTWFSDAITMGTDGEQHFIFPSLISINWRVITQEWGTRKSWTGSIWYIIKTTCAFSLPSRDLIADSIEAVVMVNLLHLGENAPVISNMTTGPTLRWKHLHSWVRQKHARLFHGGCPTQQTDNYCVWWHNSTRCQTFGCELRLSWNYIILIHFCRLPFDGEEERRNRQYFRCFRIIWYMQLNLFPCLLLKVP